MNRLFGGDKQIKLLKQFKNDGVVFSGRIFMDVDVHFNLSSPFFKMAPGSIKVGEDSKFSKGFICDAYGGKVNIGKNVFFGPYCVLYGHGNITIGDDCLIAMGCKIVAANHTVPGPGQLINKQPDKPSPIIIGKDVWLGANVIILAGVNIGDGSVIAAGSVVNNDIPAFSYAAGVPAKISKKRE